MPPYIDFYLLLDNTPSMGVGATTADIATMVNNTPDQCAFACHDLSTHPNDYYKKAKQLGVQMRIDVVRSATRTVDGHGVRDRDPQQPVSRGDLHLRLVLHQSRTDHHQVADLEPVERKAAAENIDLMTIPYQGYNNDQCTNFDDALTGREQRDLHAGERHHGIVAAEVPVLRVRRRQRRATIPTSCSKPLTGGTRCQEPIDVSFCTTIKNRGIKIAVLYTTYLPLPTNPWYNIGSRRCRTRSAPT